jgi:hypothetical protein
MDLVCFVNINMHTKHAIGMFSKNEFGMFSKHAVGLVTLLQGRWHVYIT